MGDLTFSVPVDPKKMEFQCRLGHQDFLDAFGADSVLGQERRGQLHGEGFAFLTFLLVGSLLHYQEEFYLFCRTLFLDES